VPVSVVAFAVPRTGWSRRASAAARDFVATHTSVEALLIEPIVNRLVR